MSVDRERCITCGEVAVSAVVVAIDGDAAMVEVQGRREHVAIDLLEESVAAGDVLLCHAGIALQRVEAS
jgi:hydrogenase maturation factor